MGPVSAKPQESLNTLDRVSKMDIHVNGIKYTVVDPDPVMMLSEWLRMHLNLKGLKTVCDEGGCGCCVVAFSGKDPCEHPESIMAINSCLCPLLSLDGCHVITIEGIGSKKDGFHKLQERLSQYFASQCGYCSTGFVMNAFSMMVGNPKRSEQEIEDHFDGNICRCTGYRPILDAMKSFAQTKDPVDIEDLSTYRAKYCCKKNTFLPEHQMIDHSRDSQSNALWYSPKTLDELRKIVQTCNGTRVRLVAGNTGVGIFKDVESYKCFVKIRDLQELKAVEVNEDHLLVGSAVTLTSFIKILQDNTTKSPSFDSMAEHLKKVGSLPVRNVGTWAGNLMLTHDHDHFPSDVFVILEAVGATLNIVDSLGNHSSCDLSKFLDTDMKNRIITSMKLPFSRRNEVFKTYKVMPRQQNSYAYVNAGFSVLFDPKTLTITGRPSVVYGGITKQAVHATSTETFLEGKIISNSKVLQDAVQILSEEINPTYTQTSTSAEYRRSVAVNLFYKFYLSLLGDNVPGRLKSASEPFIRPLSSGQQSYTSSSKTYPVNEPLPRTDAKLQASGEVLYTDDLPKYPNEVYAAFVVSEQGNATLGEINIDDAKKMPGYLGILTHRDIPGDNTWVKPIEDEILAVDKVEFVGQPVAIVVADTQVHANAIAKRVQIGYTNIKKPILSIKEAIGMQSFFPKRFPDVILGDTEVVFRNCKNIVTGEVATGAQHPFHLETHTCLVIPQEDVFKVFSATQAAIDIQSTIAGALGIDSCRVDVSVTRLGGAFGGKIKNSRLVAAAVAVVANKLNRPVRMTMTLNDNLISVGKRAPHLAKYKVGFDDDGLLQAIEADIYNDCGKTLNSTDAMASKGILDNAYYCSNWRVTVTECKTNTPTNTYVRGPGKVQGYYIAETMIDHVSKHLGQPPEIIKERNLYKDGLVTYSLPDLPLSNCIIRDLWRDLKDKCDFDNRKVQVDKFNQENRWRKRGLSMMPLTYKHKYYIFNFTALVSIYYSDGTVAVSHGGVDMGQGMNTKVIQVAARTLGIPLDIISVKPMTTITSPNSIVTGGSISSELNCAAVHKCCEMLIERMKPVREKYPNASWKELVSECAKTRVDLSAKYMYTNMEKFSFAYATYGACCSEVEIDVLTGETHVRRADILYDCGESVNPAMDIGQVEGGFVMGMGQWLTENVKYDPECGRPVTDGTWEYKPPMPKDIPVDFRIYLDSRIPNPIHQVVKGKAVGEPPMCLSVSCAFAVRRAIEAGRAEVEEKIDYFQLELVLPCCCSVIESGPYESTLQVGPSPIYLDAPVTVDRVKDLCPTPVSHLTI